MTGINEVFNNIDKPMNEERLQLIVPVLIPFMQTSYNG